MVVWRELFVELMVMRRTGYRKDTRKKEGEQGEGASSDDDVSR